MAKKGPDCWALVIHSFDALGPFGTTATCTKIKYGGAISYHYRAAGEIEGTLFEDRA